MIMAEALRLFAEIMDLALNDRRAFALWIQENIDEPRTVDEIVEAWERILYAAEN